MTKFKCKHPDCNAVFAQSAHLSSHSRIHTGSRPYKCLHTGCDAAFAQSSALASHVRTHTGQRPYKCQVDGCGKAFAQSNDLTKHVRTHTGERPFLCPYPTCGKRFTQSANLATHRRQHRGLKTQRGPREEEKVALALEAAGIGFKREHRVDYSCIGDTYGKADFVIDLNGGIIIVEVDEKQHRQYGVACDASRMAKIHTALALGGNSLPLAFIRYNPHSYVVNNKRAFCSTKDRLKSLGRVIKTWEHGPSASLSIQYMFYDMKRVDEKSTDLVIWEDPGYDHCLIACCRPPVG